MDADTSSLIVKPDSTRELPVSSVPASIGRFHGPERLHGSLSKYCHQWGSDLEEGCENRGKAA